jgi:hypothetical protein
MILLIRSILLKIASKFRSCSLNHFSSVKVDLLVIHFFSSFRNELLNLPIDMYCDPWNIADTSWPRQSQHIHVYHNLRQRSPQKRHTQQSVRTAAAAIRSTWIGFKLQSRPAIGLAPSWSAPIPAANCNRTLIIQSPSPGYKNRNKLVMYVSMSFSKLFWSSVGSRPFQLYMHPAISQSIREALVVVDQSKVTPVVHVWSSQFLCWEHEEYHSWCQKLKRDGDFAGFCVTIGSKGYVLYALVAVCLIWSTLFSYLSIKTSFLLKKFQQHKIVWCSKQALCILNHYHIREK